jgi:hypothetical protein
VIPDDRPRESSPDGLLIPSEPWTLLLGPSSSYLGFDHENLGTVTLKQSLGGPVLSDVAATLRWDLEVAARTMLPDRIILAVHRSMLINRSSHIGNPCLTPVFVERSDANLETELGCEAQGAKESLQMTLARIDPWARRRTLMLQALGGQLGVALGIRVPRSPDGSLVAGGDVPADRERMGRLIGSATRNGVFGKPLDGMQGRAARWIDRVTRSLGIPVVTVVMPEGSAYRARFPPNNHGADLAMLPGRVVDLWSFLGDEEMLDHTHPGPEGRRKLTARLAEVIAAGDLRP